MNRQHQKVIGFLGGGQLGMMIAACAKQWGYRVHSYDEHEDVSICSYTDKHIVGRFNDYEAMDAFCQTCDVITYEFENIDSTVVERLALKHAIPQGSKALWYASNRVREQAFAKSLAIRTLDSIVVRSSDELASAAKKLGFPLISKSVVLGYDGHGQMRFDSEADFESYPDQLESILQRFIPLDMEVSVIVVRGSDTVRCFEPIENIHTQSILDYSISPARLDPALKQEILEASIKVVSALDYQGVMALEFFISGGVVYFNEMAPRVHNSGHLTHEACNCSQFAMHLHSICQHPLPRIIQPYEAIMVNVLGENYRCLDRINEVALDSAAAIHDYHKDQMKRNRKMAHVTLVSDSRQQVLKDGMKVRDILHGK